MGQYFRYFAATPDEAAACVVNGTESTGVPQTEVKWVDPVVLLGELCALARGQDFTAEEGVARYADDEPPEEGTAPLLRLHREDVTVLSSLSDEALLPLAARWAASDNWVMPEDPNELADVIGELRTIAHAATREGHGMYASFSV
ncbi:hypothetical protein [Streptomyces avicenniae]|uniref:hypothetical protein n=1 Tax=Streptomyces avicenniae TaxID=500153 RepID=UPI00069B3DA0|nr:hypothetical protein [Streptomyces avicenniae]